MVRTPYQFLGRLSTGAARNSAHLMHATRKKDGFSSALTSSGKREGGNMSEITLESATQPFLV
jgi:hypothetical protein